MPKHVKALQKVYYAGREYKPGEMFYAQADTDAEAMVLVGTASYEPEPAPKLAPTPKRRMTVEEVAAANEVSQDRPRRYSRRDMQAEDD